MPNFPIIDAHLHLWDPSRIAMAWLKPGSSLAQAHAVEDYTRDCGAQPVEAMVFVECFVDEGEFVHEVAFVEEQRRRDPRIKSIVARAAVENGRRVLDDLTPLKERHPAIKGVRRLIELDPDPQVCLKPGFIEGVRALAEMDLSFDVNVHHSQMAEAVDFARQVGDVRLILDHCGKPGIKAGLIEPWRSHIRALAELPNVFCKLSDLPVEADRQSWSAAQLRPYIDAVVDAFGFDRLIYGGDWPVCLQATDLRRWIGVLDEAFRGCSADEMRKFYRDNAVAFYRMES